MKTTGKRILIELGAVVFLVAFIWFMMRDGGTTGVSVSALTAALSEEGYLDDMEEASGRILKKNLSLDANDYEELAYYAPISFMDVNELLIIHDAGEDFSAAKEGIEAHLTAQKQTFENYGTDQYDLLQAAVIYEKDDYLVFIVGQQADEMLQSLKKQIEG